MKIIKDKVFFYGVIVFLLLLTMSSISSDTPLNIVLIQNNQVIEIKIDGGNPPYRSVLTGDRFNVKEYKSNTIKIQNPPKGNYILNVHDSKTGSEYLIFEVK